MFKWLTERHPLAWLLFYAALTPLFAFIYQYACGNAFLMPNLQIEPRFQKMKDELSEELNNSVQNHMDELRKPIKDCMLKPLHYKLNHVGAYRDDSNTDTINIVVECESVRSIRNNAFPITSYNFWRFPIDLSQEPKLRSDGRDEFLQIVGGLKRDYDPEKNVDLMRHVFPGFVVKLNRSSYDLIKKIYALKSGDITQVNGYLFEMLYLSVVIITTLGLGDIIPITDLSRSFVGLEAFFGVLTFGLFFNSVAYQASR